MAHTISTKFIGSIQIEHCAGDDIEAEYVILNPDGDTAYTDDEERAEEIARENCDNFDEAADEIESGEHQLDEVTRG